MAPPLPRRRAGERGRALTEHDLPLCAHGRLQLVHPGEFREVLASWVQQDPNKRYTPFALTAFNELFFIRKLGAGSIIPDPDSPFDLYYLDPHRGRISFVSWSPLDLLRLWDRSLTPSDRPTAFVPDLRHALVDEALERDGPLSAGECFHFAPALALGGAERIEHVARGDAAVHLALLRNVR